MMFHSPCGLPLSITQKLMLPLNKSEQFEEMVILAWPIMAKGNSWDIEKWDTHASPAPMGPYSQMLQEPFVFHLSSC